MATAQALPSPPLPVPPTHSTEIARQGELENDEALVPVLHAPLAAEGIKLTPALARLPVELDVAVPVPNFRVRNLLALELGTVIETQWGHGDDMPLAAGSVQLAWSEFEVVETALAVRVTRLV
jgi:flagellar motor switch/type III secretory pathway protein FliN